ncbi:IS3 family transposase [Schaalia canis]|uniref:IS3 family transposase n=1 Tax=Schaalia canis TaxID=100469 RepID=UPI001403D1E3
MQVRTSIAIVSGPVFICQILARRWHTPEEVATAIDAYIRFYNDHRIKLNLRGKSPVQYRQSLAA